MANLHRILVSSLWVWPVMSGQVVSSSFACHYQAMLTTQTHSLLHTSHRPHPQTEEVLGFVRHHLLSTLQIYCLTNHLFPNLLLEILGRVTPTLNLVGRTFVKFPSLVTKISFLYLPIYHNHGTICIEYCQLNCLKEVNGLGESVLPQGWLGVCLVLHSWQP